MTKTFAADKHDPEARLPLSAAVFSILMALADGEKHGGDRDNQREATGGPMS